MSPASTLRTARLLLRPWTEEDLAPFAGLNTDPRVMRFMAHHLTPEDSDALGRRIARRLEERGWGLWAVEVLGGARFIGFVGLSEPIFQAHFTPCAEIGWRLAFDHWGRGYATEAATAARDFAFESIGLDELVSFTVVANTRSRAVMERIGMTRRAADDFDHPNLEPAHPLRPHVLYRLNRAAWQTTLPKPPGPR